MYFDLFFINWLFIIINSIWFRYFIAKLPKFMENIPKYLKILVTYCLDWLFVTSLCYQASVGSNKVFLDTVVYSGIKKFKNVETL